MIKNSNDNNETTIERPVQNILSVQEGSYRISPDELLAPYHYSPADNIEGYTTHLPWKSRIVGGWIRNTLQWKNILKTVSKSPHIFGHLSGVAYFHKWLIEHNITNPINLHAKIATRAGFTPDTYAEHDENVENAYGNMIYELCTLCMTKKSSDDPDSASVISNSNSTSTSNPKSLNFISTFDIDKCKNLSSTQDGIATLKRYMKDFAQLEWQYNSLGLTRLKAMKELLISLLIVITEKPLNGEDESSEASASITPKPKLNIAEIIKSKKRAMPFEIKQKPGKPAPSFSQYLETARIRLENLYNHNAFNIKLFAEYYTNGKIGFSEYEIVEGSTIHTVTLRHYLLPKGIEPNGKILYMVSPLINKAEIFDLAEGKSVVQGMLESGYTIYLQAPGDPGVEDTKLGLDFYGKVVHDKYLDIIKRLHQIRKFMSWDIVWVELFLCHILPEELKSV
jgi:hypothetical protein